MNSPRKTRSKGPQSHLKSWGHSHLHARSFFPVNLSISSLCWSISMQLNNPQYSRTFKNLGPRGNMVLGWGWSCYLSWPMEQRDMGEISPENTLQGPAEPFEIVGPLPPPRTVSFPRQSLHFLALLVHIYAINQPPVF